MILLLLRAIAARLFPARQLGQVDKATARARLNLATARPVLPVVTPRRGCAAGQVVVLDVGARLECAL